MTPVQARISSRVHHLEASARDGAATANLQLPRTQGDARARDRGDDKDEDDDDDDDDDDAEGGGLVCCAARPFSRSADMDLSCW